MSRARIVTAVPRRASAAPFVPPASFGNRNRFFGGGSGLSLQQLLNPVPGLGFDYSHLEAISSDLDMKAVIDPETQWKLAVAEQVQRDTAGYASPGYYLLDGGGAYLMATEPAAEQPAGPAQPTIILVQQPTTEKPAAEPIPTAAPPVPEAPLPNISNFTLVLKNGTKIQAIAFTRAGDSIVYITSDGERHTLAAADLDTDATRQLNERSGRQLQF